MSLLVSRFLLFFFFGKQNWIFLGLNSDCLDMDYNCLHDNTDKDTFIVEI